MRRDWLDGGRRSARHALLFTCLAACAAAQELQPRAYLRAPIGLNYFGVSYGNNNGILYTFEGAAGVWLYKANSCFLGSSVRSQVPLGSLQLQIQRALPRRMWAGVDWTVFTGGRDPT